MTSGTCALVMGIYLGKRRGYGTEKLAYRPHSVSHVVLGTGTSFPTPPPRKSLTGFSTQSCSGSDGLVSMGEFRYASPSRGKN